MSLAQNAFASAHITHSTGRFVPADCPGDGFFPASASYCPCVTSYFPSQNPCDSVTPCCLSHSSRPSSPSGLPIVKLPGSTPTISKTTSFVSTIAKSAQFLASATRAPASPTPNTPSSGPSTDGP